MIYFSGKFQSEAFLQYKDENGDREDEGGSFENEPSKNDNEYHRKQNGCNRHLHPVFPGNGQLILGQEQEKPCGGFDDTDSLSADIARFEVMIFQNQCHLKFCIILSHTKSTNITCFFILKMFQIWNRILAEEELLTLAKCEGDIPHGKVVSWSESKHLWKWSDITVEEFKKGADRTLCGKTGYA